MHMPVAFAFFMDNGDARLSRKPKNLFDIPNGRLKVRNRYLCIVWRV